MANHITPNNGGTPVRVPSAPKPPAGHPPATSTDQVPSRPLNARQLRFIEEYLFDCNAAQAYRRAGYEAEHAHVNACKLLKNAAVACAIADAQAARSRRCAFTADEVLRELSRQIFSDPADLVGPDGLLLPLHLIPAETRRAISAVDIRPKREREKKKEEKADSAKPEPGHGIPKVEREPGDSPDVTIPERIGADAEKPEPAIKAQVFRIRFADKMKAIAVALDHLRLRHPIDVQAARDELATLANGHLRKAIK